MITYTDRPELADNEHLILAENIDRVDHKIELANRKLERNGIDARFSYTVIGEWVQGTYLDGQDEEEGTVQVRNVIVINHPKLGLEGFTFIGTVVVEDGGTMVQMVPGEATPEGYARPDSHNCDHCGVRRDRKRSYLVREDATGAVKQIGSTCLELFFGLQIKGLWMLDMFTAEELAEWNEPTGEGGTRVEHSYDPSYLIAMAFVLTHGGKGFISRGSADYESGRVATADQVLEVIHHRPIGRRDYEKEAKIEGIRNDTRDMLNNNPEKVAEILAFAETLGVSDYAQNAQVAARSNAISYRAIGVLVSLVGVWYRAQAKEAAAKVVKAERNQEFVGQVKERLRGLKLTVVSMKEFENDFGTTTLLVMTDAENHTFKWFASKMFDFEVGAVLTLDATVKAHETYQGNNESVLTRGSIKEVEGK